MIRGLTFGCVMLSVCGLAVTAQAQMEGTHQAQMVARMVQQQSNVDLPSAIQTAEQQTNGRAINADAFVPPPWETGGTEQLKFAITTVTNDNQLLTVFIDGQSGRVENVQPVTGGRMGMGTSQQMGYGQAPYRQQFGSCPQPSFQRQPGWQWSMQRGYGDQWQPGRWQGVQQRWQDQGGWTPRYGGEQFDRQQYWGPQQQWGGGQQFEMEEYEAQAYPPDESQYGAPPQGWGGQFGRMGGAQMMEVHPARASKIIGNVVVNDQNQDIGRIADLAINTFTGRVPFAVLDANNNFYPVPFRLIHPVGDNQVVLDIPQQRLQNLPTLDKANWPQTVNERLVATVHQILGLRPEFGYAGFRDDEAGAPPGPPQTQPAGPGAQPGQPGAMPIRKATDLMNQQVRSHQGENLGTIRDLVIDPQRARLAYVVVSFNNMRDSLLAVPWDAFSVQQGQVMLNADPNRLQQAQALSFSSENWPDMSNPEWAQRVAEVWGTQPYPMTGSGRMMGGQMRGGMQRPMRSGPQGQPGGGQQPSGGNMP